MKLWPESAKAREARAVQEQKKQKQQARAYAAAQFNRLVSNWVAASTSADAEILNSLPKLRNRTRQLARDNDYVRAFLTAAQDNVVGNGIPFQSQFTKGNDLQNQQINDQIETEWRRWGRKEFCHAAGALSFTGIEKVVLRTVLEGGEVFVRKVSQRFAGSKIPFALQVFEGDQFCDEMNGVASNGNQIRMGIEKDAWGRAVAYYMRPNHPGDYQFYGAATGNNAPMRIPAEEILHVFLRERAGQTRGVPWIVSSIMRFHHMQGYEEAEVINARATASLMGFIESPEGEITGDGVEDGDQVTEFEPGVFKNLGPGEKVSVPDLHRPSGEFSPFVTKMIEGAAAGCGASYETISKDYSRSNYSSTRQSLINERDHWQIIQNWFIENFHQPIFEAWLDRAVLSGAVKIPKYELTPEEYREVLWMPRGWQWIDPYKDVLASKEAIKAGLATQTSILAQSGLDFETVILQRKREIEFAKANGVPIDLNVIEQKNSTQMDQQDAEGDGGKSEGN